MAESVGWGRGYECSARRRLLASSLRGIDSYGGHSLVTSCGGGCGSQTGVSLKHGGRSHFLSSQGVMWWCWQYRRDTVKNGVRQPESSDLERRGIWQTCEQRPDLFIKEVLQIAREDGGQSSWGGSSQRTEQEMLTAFARQQNPEVKIKSVMM